MKTIISICIFAIAVLFSLNGCSEKSELPNEPVNSLDKVTITNFSAVLYATGLIDPGTVKIVGQNYFRTNQVVQCTTLTDNEMVTGTATLTKSNRYNVETGEGVLRGTLNITPDNYPDAVWEITWEGTRSKTGESEWSSYITMVGIGEGDEIDGMKIHIEGVVTDDDIYGELGFYGTGTGYIKSKE
jgi:hypothetical protein